MKFLSFTLLSAATLIIFWLNIKLHTEHHDRASEQVDIERQLNFIEVELKEKELGRMMQHLYPEGFVFVNALYGLSWCELAMAEPNNEALQARALREALYVYNEIDSKQGRAPFPDGLQPEHGIFYCGWRNYLLAKILQAHPDFENRDQYVNTFQKQSWAIALAMRNAQTPYLRSYSVRSWPADMFVAMASLSVHDQLFGARYQNDLQSWLVQVKSISKPGKNLLPHEVDYQSGEAIGAARGSSMGLMLRMLQEIDPEFGQELFTLFEERFVFTRFGLPAVREYPKGNDGTGDVDSGPVVFGVGFTATIVSLGPFAQYGLKDLYTRQYQTIHAFGFDQTPGDKKKYLFGKLPMADAFIAWGRASGLQYPPSELEEKATRWRWQFHITSFFLLLGIYALAFRKRLMKRLRPNAA